MLLLFTPVLFVLSCTSQVENPSGNCKAKSNGERLFYHSVEKGTTYLPDCQNPLDRELWRVFAVSENSAYIMPRPDSTGIQYGMCEGEDVELADLFDQYGLCEELGNPIIINDILPADALLITNTLHQLLRFEIGEDGMITPWAPEDDILAACKLTNNEAALEFCALLESRCNRGIRVSVCTRCARFRPP